MHSREGTYAAQSSVQLEGSARAGSSRAYSAGGTWDDDPQEWGGAAHPSAASAALPGFAASPVPPAAQQQYLAGPMRSPLPGPTFSPPSSSPTPAARGPTLPPRRSATLPTPTHAATVPTAHAPTPVALPADPALAAFHRSLVAYYWNFAQQGFVAPLTAPEGSVERVRQQVARKEAVDWALTCGIAVVEPSLAGMGQQGAPSQTAEACAGAGASQSYVRPPLPAGLHGAGRQVVSSAPPPSESQRTGGSAARPLPSPIPPAANLMNTPTTRSPLPSTPASSAPLSHAKSSSPSPSAYVSPAHDTPGLPLSFSTSTTSAQDSPAAAPAKRPLPVPPLAQLASGMRGISLAGTGEVASPVGAVPSIALPEYDGGQEVTVSPSVKPTVPTFSFDDGGADEHEAYGVAPVVPTFSFDDFDDENDSPSTSARPAAPHRASARAVPLHPRHDPSHPSHRLYHPTSVLPSSTSSSTSSPAHASLPEAGTLTCTSCRALIFGRVLVALGREWHPDCFRCAEEGCGARLEVMEFEGTPEDWKGLEEGEGEREEDLQGKAWCMVHFEERFALECHHCRTPIASADYLPIHDPLLPPRADYRHPSTRYYHPLHFFCAGCGDPFVDPTSYELLPASSADGLEATPYVAREGHPYCDACDLRMWREKCPGCGKGLREEDGFLEVEGAKWHEGCFRCSMCTKPLTGFYLLRRDAPTSASSPSQSPSQKEDADEYADERPYCAECYDVKAKEEAEQAIASRVR
ncbi:uncharacterized protein JCM10292_003080 [Rhodotorula paludigena]|uniref:uncharacterized protein n=1 Tax=Rhodotorula paludigena TaxID=86838 RepID=UPI0031787D5E